jgi:DNA-binding transcriptional MerR regulator
MENYKTIGEVSEQLNIQPHVLRFWETQFKQIKPVKRRAGRRFYSDNDIEVIENIRIMLHVRGLTIKGAQKELTRKNQNFFMQFSNDKKPEVKSDKAKNSVDIETKKIRGIVTKLKILQEQLIEA